MVHFNVPRDWFEINLQHQKCYSEGGKNIRECCGLLGRVVVAAGGSCGGGGSGSSNGSGSEC